MTQESIIDCGFCLANEQKQQKYNDMKLKRPDSWDVIGILVKKDHWVHAFDIKFVKYLWLQ